MSTRTALRPQIVISSANMATDIISQPTILQSLSMVSYAVSWSGTTPVGTLKVQVSNDFALDAAGQVLHPGTWSTLTLQVNGDPTDTIAVSGNLGNGFIDIEKTAAYAVRLVYTAGSGTGVMTAIVAGKVA